MDNIPSVLRVDLLVNLARYSLPQKVLLAKKKITKGAPYHKEVHRRSAISDTMLAFRAMTHF